MSTPIACLHTLQHAATLRPHYLRLRTDCSSLTTAMQVDFHSGPCDGDGVTREVLLLSVAILGVAILSVATLGVGDEGVLVLSVAILSVAILGVGDEGGGLTKCSHAKCI